MSASQPAAPASASQIRRTTTIFITLAVLAVLVLGGGCIALIAVTAKSTSVARPAAESFLASLEKRDYPGALAQMASQTKTGKKPEDLADIGALLEKRHGKATGHRGPVQFFARTFNGVSQIQFVYTMTFEKGEAPVTLTLVSEGGEWKVLSYNFTL